MHLPNLERREDTVSVLNEVSATVRDLSSNATIPTLLNFPEEVGGEIYNKSVLSRSGKLGPGYRKTHLFNAFSFREENVYRKGDKLPTVLDISGFLTSFLICYDLRFPELARLLALQGTELLIYQAGWFAGERKEDQWKTMLRSRAIENGFYVAGSAQTGESFTGHSIIFSPEGDVLAQLGKEEGICIADLSKERVSRYRQDSGVLSGRREDLYTLRSV